MGIFDLSRINNTEANAGELFMQNVSLQNATTSNRADNASTYVDGEKGASVTPAADGTSQNALGTDSLFNPFRIFRYSKFGAPDGKGYDASRHKFEYNGEAFVEPIVTNSNNPTATAIIEWANMKADSSTGPLYPYPYQINDFLWCRHYGKIPNNRMLTLRRYPIPVEDNLAVHKEKLPLVPIAQAVTWWGGDTGNTLGSVFGMTYGLNWTQDLKTEMQDVAGNELGIEKLYETLGIKDETVRKALSAGLLATGSDGAIIASEQDKRLQDWEKAAYGSEGAYWNRIKGPVNIINSTKNRGVGYIFTHTIKIDFEYNLRSYGRINPKVAMLDVISNFLSLTYNNAEFYGGGIRYFKQTGLLIPPFNTDEMEKGNFIGALGTLAAMTGDQLNETSIVVKKWLDSVKIDINAADGGAAKATEVIKSLGTSNLANVLQASRISTMMQKPLNMRSMLDGRAVGEWHLMVGNPMNPLAVIGNLCLTSTSMSFSEELGEEDFPISVKFTVSLEPGRPRAKQDIESMFNMGGGDLTFTPLADPVSSFGSFGEYADIKLGESRQSIQDSTRTPAEASAANNLAQYFRGNVARAYGDNFAKSPILSSYFNNRVTKD